MARRLPSYPGGVADDVCTTRPVRLARLAVTLYGRDVSHHQEKTPSLAGKGFLFPRPTIGTAPDSRYDKHIAKARNAGLVTGAYHFNWSRASVAEQVTHFL